MLDLCTPLPKPLLPSGEVDAVLGASLCLLGTPLSLTAEEKSPGSLQAAASLRGCCCVHGKGTLEINNYHLGILLEARSPSSLQTDSKLQLWGCAGFSKGVVIFTFPFKRWLCRAGAWRQIALLSSFKTAGC